MNPDTGEIRDFAEEFKYEKTISVNSKKAIPEGWVSWEIGEQVEVKGCCFEVAHIDKTLRLITFRAIPKARYKMPREN